jgi:metal-dependent amidase/aminoacylase/carboxypeptidase family protein
VKQRPALGVLFASLAIGFAGVAFAAGHGAGHQVGRWIVVGAAAALAAWLATLAFRTLR